MASNRLSRMTAQFLKQIGFSCGNSIWLGASWDLPPKLAPKSWKRYLSPRGTTLIHYIFTGTITRNGLFSLHSCTFGGRDKEGNTRWLPVRKRTQNGYSKMLKLSKLGATISFYPNQPQGGICNAHVQQCHCLFYEIDNLPLKAQWQQLHQLSEQTNLQPSAVVFTGNKSLHVYFRCKQPLAPTQWLKLNRKLTIVQTADPQICNPARAMRLPGMYRRKLIADKLSKAIPITLEQTSQCRYSPKLLNQALNSTERFPYGLSNQRWRKWVSLLQQARNGVDINPDAALSQLLHRLSLTQSPPKSRVDSYSCQQLPSTNSSTLRRLGGSLTSIPLSLCLTRDDQRLLKHGETEGNRNCAGYKLARNLLGTAELLKRHGIHFHPESTELFEQFCHRCQPSIDTAEADTIWNSANKSPANASRDSISIARTLSWWRRNSCRELDKS